ncbi:protein mono-ADP-ribosyltransferase PARP12 [Pangasianodon hypophthalmus]|uniref:protein mono-ADP-ribosyltransferase PARP12 n=1 Tax=Pangasianodon hypophthalmus TaxID=310915 RepID=UPI0023077E6C|nr:protein mono-ADP-ribosyltransferase PARP12 [Pangasianodon hypophthalmus]
MSALLTMESLLKRICANDGAMLYDDLLCGSRSGFLDEWFSSSPVDTVVEGSDSLVTVFVNGQKTVIARTGMKLCRAKNCSGCLNLHLCKFFLFGDCQYGRGRRGCRFNHDLQKEQNVLQAHGLSQLDRRELCTLLLQSDNSILPPVCHSYNNGTGLYGRCEDGENCKRLHICEKYLRGPCQCPRAHDFYEPHPLKTLQDRGVPAELMASMKTTYSNIEALRIMAKVRQPQNGGRFQENNGQRSNRNGNWQKQTSADANATGSGGPRTNRGSNPRNPQCSQEKKEICMYFIKGHCRNGDKCFKEHSKVPYKWEVKEGLGWVALPDNEGIERDYSNPAKTYSSGVCFDTMTRGYDVVRRLSTVSSVIQPNYILTTTWAWHWEDEYGNWIQYASSGGGHNTASITSEDLEQKFTQDSKAEVEFTAGSQTYTLSFQDMIQTNKRYGTKKLVRRRPVFVSAADAQTIRTTKPAPNSQMKTLPSHWNKAQTPEIGYKKLLLQKDSSEYTAIERLFNTTMRGFGIQQIERIQNRALWEVFQWQKDLMKKNNTGNNVAEKQLFHGTDSKHIDAICLNNFDWRICGTHGTAYGKGSYFARDAKYSHSYTGDSTTRCMFVCRVLVGDYTLGNSSYTRPPSKDGGDTIFYDSCVNDVHNPSIFVVFEKHQIYPEYLIKYSETSQSSSPYHRSTPSVANRAAYVPTASTYQPNPAATVRKITSTYQPKPAPTVQTATPTYQPQPAASSYSSTYSSLSYSRPPTPRQSKPDNSCIIC